MKSKFTICFVLLIVLPFFMFSQSEEIDSLKNIYTNLKDGKEKIKLSHQLFKLTIHHDKGLAFNYANEQLVLSKQFKYVKGEGTAYRDIAYYYRFLPQVDSARHYFKKSVKTFKDNGNRERQCTALDRFATFEIVQGNYETALELVDESIDVATELKNGRILVDNLQRKSVIYLDLADFASAMEVTLKSLKIADTIKPSYLIGKAVGLSDVGRIEIHRGNYKAALVPTKNALAILKELNEIKWQAIVLNQLGNAYWELENYDESLDSYQQSLKIVQSINRKDYVAVALANIAGIHSKKGDYNKALKMLNEAQEITLKIGTISNIINNYGSIGDVHFEHNKLNKAITNYSQAIHIADSVKALDDLYSMYKSRSKAYEKTGNYKNALADQRQYQILYDSIFSAKSIRQIENLKTKYQTEKKEKEIELLKQKENISKGKQQQLILALFSLFILAASLYYGIYQKLQRSKLERDKLNIELDHKKNELTSHALHLAKKNEVLENLKQKAKNLKENNTGITGYNQLIQTINFDLQDDNNWENFKKYFEEVHQNFSHNVKQKFPTVTSNELRLMALLKMNLSSKEIANILNISNDGIKKARYRLRKKLKLSTEDSLQEIVLAL